MEKLSVSPEEKAQISAPGSDYAEHAKSGIEIQFANVKSAEYAGGRAPYRVIGEGRANRNPIVSFPGFSGNLVSGKKFNMALANEGDRVIAVDQPKYRGVLRNLSQKKLSTELSGVEHQAQALISVIEAEGLTGEPVDAVTASMGFLTLLRAAEIAKEKGYKTFDSEAGAHSYVVAPSGIVPDETLRSLAGRYMDFLAHNFKAAKRHDPGNKMGNADTKAVLLHPVKSTKEVHDLHSKKADFKKFGNIGLKPFVLTMGNDLMFPYHHKAKRSGEIGPSLEANLGLNDEADPALSGVASPVDPSRRTAKDYKTFIEKFGSKIKDENLSLSEKALKKKIEGEWIDANSNVGHGALTHRPEMIAAGIKQARESQYSQQPAV